MEKEEDIKHWNPFLASFNGYDGKRYNVTFTCPVCGSHSCKRKGSNKDTCFFEGLFECTKCGKQGFCYYSDSFKRKEAKIIKQLTFKFK